MEPLESSRTDESVVPCAVVEAGNAEDIVRECDFAEMFLNKLVKEKQTRSQKRVQRRSHGLERAKDQRQQRTEVLPSQDELLQLQVTDVTLDTIRAVSEGRTDNVQDGYFQQDELIFRRWISPNQGVVTSVDKLVLPVKCHSLFYTLLSLHTLFPLQVIWKKEDCRANIEILLAENTAEFC